MATKSVLLPAQVATWSNLLLAHDQMLEHIDTELTEKVGLSLGDYEVLLHLAEAPDHQMRMNELAALTRLSPSGLTRRFDSLVRRGWVSRTKSSDDGRGIFAGVTKSGLTKVNAARPVHDLAVRTHCFDQLTNDQTKALSKIVGQLTDDTIS